LTLREISNKRLNSQKIAGTTFNTAAEIVGWMGAIQAQDYSMAKWAIGVRLLSHSEERIAASFKKGEIIRIHLMRPTWHFVSPADIYWMLELTAQHIKSSLKSRHKELEFTGAIIGKSKDVLVKALLTRKFLTREELANEFSKANIRTDDNRLSHLMLWAELEGLVCSGKMKGGKQTYALLQERVPVRKSLTRDESLSELAKRYFTSHGPATLKDFAWWSGLPVADARRALDFIKPDFFSEIIGPEQYWFADSSSDFNHKTKSVHLLPAYDEFLISYKDRSASLLRGDNKKSVSNNGIFYPIIVVNGIVTGFWKRSTRGNKINIEVNFFRPQEQLIIRLVKDAASRLGSFLGKEAEVRIIKN